MCIQSYFKGLTKGAKTHTKRAMCLVFYKFVLTLHPLRINACPKINIFYQSAISPRIFQKIYMLELCNIIKMS
jgi:hypothetical protein